MAIVIFGAIAFVFKIVHADRFELFLGLIVIATICKVANAEQAAMGHAGVAQRARSVFVSFSVFATRSTGATEVFSRVIVSSFQVCAQSFLVPCVFDV